MCVHGLFYRKNDIWSSICFSLLIILIYNPYNIRNNGVLLSYGGTIGIISFMKKIKENTNEKSMSIKSYKNKIINYIKDIIIVSISAQIIIMPIIAYTYKTISITFFITNILVSPIIGIIIIFGFILIFISFLSIKIANFFGMIYKILIKLLLQITKISSKIPFSKIYIKLPYLSQIILYYLIIFLVYYLYNKIRKRII